MFRSWSADVCETSRVESAQCSALQLYFVEVADVYIESAIVVPCNYTVVEVADVYIESAIVMPCNYTVG